MCEDLSLVEFLNVRSPASLPTIAIEKRKATGSDLGLMDEILVRFFVHPRETRGIGWTRLMCQ